MKKEDIEDIFEFYKLSNKLTTMLRKGWLNYNLEVGRIESVAEHVFSSCMLGIAIFAKADININLYKAMTMMLLHETEELFLPDIMPIDINYKKQTSQVLKAREDIIALFKKFKKENVLDLFYEYEKCETAEAKFAKQLDKLQSDFQAKLYEGSFNTKKSKDSEPNDEKMMLKTPEINNKIYKLFIHNHKPKYSGVFLELADWLEEKK